MKKVKKIWSGEDFEKELEIDVVGKQIYQDIKEERFFLQLF